MESILSFIGVTLFYPYFIVLLWVFLETEVFREIFYLLDFFEDLAEFYVNFLKDYLLWSGFYFLSSSILNIDSDFFSGFFKFGTIFLDSTKLHLDKSMLFKAPREILSLEDLGELYVLLDIFSSSKAVSLFFIMQN